VAVTNVDGLTTSALTADEIAQFRDRGYVHVRGAFASDAAAEMRDVVWSALERDGIRRDQPATWVQEAPSHLQHLKRAPAFAAVGTERTIAAIDDLLGAGRWRMPRDWGGFFLLFPTPRPWNVPHKVWHLDHSYTGAADPPSGLKVHAMFGDVEPRAGGMTIVAGSHVVIERAMATSPPPPGSPANRVRRHLMRTVPYLRALSTEGPPEQRIARFADVEEEVLGHRLQVVELTAAAGDVILIHPMVLHTRPTNAGTSPRFLLNKDLRLVVP
jgi:hypothetical protein